MNVLEIMKEIGGRLIVRNGIIYIVTESKSYRYIQGSLLEV